MVGTLGLTFKHYSVSTIKDKVGMLERWVNLLTLQRFNIKTTEKQ